jgi:hypothetical protein
MITRRKTCIAKNTLRILLVAESNCSDELIVLECFWDQPVLRRLHLANSGRARRHA